VKSIKSLKQFAKTWEISFILALLQDLVAAPNDRDKVIQLYKEFYEFIYTNKLEQIYDLPYLLGGKQVQELFQVKGPAIQTIKENTFYWQINNRNATLDDLKDAIS